jgi:hypothetical protein
MLLQITGCSYERLEKTRYDVGWVGLKIRHWRNGLLLAYHAWDANPYALLDTAAGTMKLWQPAGEFEWLNECVDAKWSSVGGLCLKEIPDTLGFVLLRNGVDTLAVRDGSFLRFRLKFASEL